MGLRMKQRATAQAMATVGAACLLVSVLGCAQLNDTGLAILSSNLPAVAIVDGQLLQGEIQLFPDYTGTVSLHVPGAPAADPGALSSCVGRLRYTATSTGAIDLRCNGGVVGNLQMTLFGDTRGFGYGTTVNGSASLAFGMSSQESRAHLIVPPNHQLLDRSGALNLEPQ